MRNRGVEISLTTIDENIEDNIMDIMAVLLHNGLIFHSMIFTLLDVHFAVRSLNIGKWIKHSFSNRTKLNCSNIEKKKKLKKHTKKKIKAFYNRQYIPMTWKYLIEALTPSFDGIITENRRDTIKKKNSHL